MWIRSDKKKKATFDLVKGAFSLININHRWPVHEVPVDPSLRPPANLLKRLMNKDLNVYTQFKHVCRHVRVSRPKHE